MRNGNWNAGHSCCIAGRHAMVRRRSSLPRRGFPAPAAVPLRVDPCPIRSASRSTPWAATTARRWSCREPRSRSTGIPIWNSSCSATAPWSSRCSRAGPPQGGLALRPHRRRRQDGRQAEPGAAPRPLEVLDVARHRRGEEGRGRRRGLRRQYRRADGDGQVRSQDHGGHRAARPSPRCGRRCKGESIVLDVGASIGADAEHLVDLAVMGSAMARVAVRPRAADGRAPQYRRRGGQGARRGARGRPHPARRRSCRTSTMSASSKATISARAPSTWW